MVKPLISLEFLLVHAVMGSRILRRDATWENLKFFFSHKVREQLRNCSLAIAL